MKLNPDPKVRVDSLEYAIPHKDSDAKNILEEIIWYKDIEINKFKKDLPLEELIKKASKLSPTKGFLKNLSNSNFSPGIIAEIKKASPSKGLIREDFDPEEIASIYEKAGATCISVLTDKKFFKGGYEILSKVRKSTNLPLLCKDFIISPYQIYKARCSGADAILLIAAILNNDDLLYLKKIADKLAMDVLVEVHDEKEIERILDLKCFNLVGINNRDLKTFKTDLKTTYNLMQKFTNTSLLKQVLFVSESGIDNSEDLKKLKSKGINGVLIGERFMKEKDIEQGFKKLMNAFEKTT